MFTLLTISRCSLVPSVQPSPFVPSVLSLLAEAVSVWWQYLADASLRHEGQKVLKTAALVSHPGSPSYGLSAGEHLVSHTHVVFLTSCLQSTCFLFINFTLFFLLLCMVSCSQPFSLPFLIMTSAWNQHACIYLVVQRSHVQA